MNKLVEYGNRFIYQDGTTPLPIPVLVVVFSNTFFSSMVSTIVFPFLPNMVKSFGVDELDAGHDVGVIASSIYMGFFFSTIWGYISDKKGKKLCIILTGWFCIATTLMFGCSRNFYWAAITRFLQGCTVGQVVVLKGLLAEVCDDSNMAFGFSVLLTACSVGNIIGAGIGGFTSFPAIQYPESFAKGSIFGEFPVLLPNFIISIGLGIAVILTVLLLPKHRRQTAEIATLVQKGNEKKCYGAVLVFSDSTTSSSGCELMMKDAKISYFKPPKSTTTSIVSNLLEKLKSSDVIAVLKTKECLACCLLYVSFAVVDIGFQEMFPILAATDTRYNGMGFAPLQVGTVLMAVSVVLLFFQLFLLPKLSYRCGPQMILIISSLMLTFLNPMLPMIEAIRNVKLMWAGLILVIFLVRACIFAGYLSIEILVNNSADADVLDSANGITMAAYYVGRLIAPVMCGSLFSWSLGNVRGCDGNENALGFPFNQYLTFFILSIISLLIAIFAATLPKTMNNRNSVKEEKSVSTRLLRRSRGSCS